MVELHFSFIIPVFNRPQEVKELLDSLCFLQDTFEVVIIEDGSSVPCKEIVNQFQDRLTISYYYKSNSGPGDSRNYGMQRATGNYFIILDSDVLVPKGYLSTVRKALSTRYLDCYGGADKALDSFTPVQKAIDCAMTSVLTTGGLRGSLRSKISRSYEPRSFNMGISKAAFIESNGFGKIHPGEDPDLSIRLKRLKLKVGYIEGAFVYHKRRTDFKKFTQQVFKFGLVRPILLARYPDTEKLTYWFPSFYLFFFIVSILMLFFDFFFLSYFLILYNFLIFLNALFNYKSLKIAILSLIASNIQFFSYGFGFLWSYLKIKVLKHKPEQSFPSLFFR